MDSEPGAVSSFSLWLIRGRSEPPAAKAPALFELGWRAIAKPGTWGHNDTTRRSR